VLVRVLESMVEKEPPPVAPATATEPAGPPPEPRRLEDFAVYAALISVLEPLLRSSSDPAAAVSSEDTEIGRRLCQGVARLLRQSGVELFGRPGQVITVALPHSDWQMDDLVPPTRLTTALGQYRVSRRGLRINGRVVAPGLVAPSVESRS
jgi:hypothetical protein